MATGQSHSVRIDPSSLMAPRCRTRTNWASASTPPLELIKQDASGDAAGESRSNRVSHMQSANEGLADIIVKVSGSVQGDRRANDGPYYTSDEGISWPDP